MYKLQRAIDRGAASLDLSDAALQWLPQDLKTMPEPARITDINLADNDLFNGKCKPLTAIDLAGGPCQVLIQPTFAGWASLQAGAGSCARGLRSHG